MSLSAVTSAPVRDVRATRWRGRLRSILLLLFVAFVLWRLWAGLRWAAVAESLGRARLAPLVAAILILSLTNLLRALRWRALLAPAARTGVKQTLAAVVVGMIAVFLFGATGGALARPLALHSFDRRVSRAAAFLALVVENLFDLAALAALGLLALWWFSALLSGAISLPPLAPWAPLAVTLPVVVLLVLVLLRAHLARRLGERLTRWRVAQSVAARLGPAVRVEPRAGRKQLVEAGGWTLLIWLGFILATWLTLRAFALPSGWRETVFVLVWSTIGGFVPMPGGAAGAYHAAMIIGLTLLGAPLAEATAAALAAHLLGYAPVPLFLLYFFLRGDLNPGKLKRILLATAHQPPAPTI